VAIGWLGMQVSFRADRYLKHQSFQRWLRDFLAVSAEMGARSAGQSDRSRSFRPSAQALRDPIFERAAPTGMELFHSWACPYCMTVRVALAEKGVAYRAREIELGSKPRELLELNPKGEVPIWVASGRVFSDSPAILDALEAAFPLPALLPVSADGRDRVHAFSERVTATIGRRVPKIRRGTPEDKARAGAEVRRALAELEWETPSEGYLFGDYSQADITLACFVAKLPDALRPGALGLPRLARWWATVSARPSIVTHTAPEPPAPLQARAS
jgi:glutathione S-transferase